jgi:hypothetical protein
VRGDEVAGAAHRRGQLGPAHGEAQGAELGAEQVAHLAHAGTLCVPLGMFTARSSRATDAS